MLDAFVLVFVVAVYTLPSWHAVLACFVVANSWNDIVNGMRSKILKNDDGKDICDA